MILIFWNSCAMPGLPSLLASPKAQIEVACDATFRRDSHGNLAAYAIAAFLPGDTHPFYESANPIPKLRGSVGAEIHAIKAALAAFSEIMIAFQRHTDISADTSRLYVFSDSKPAIAKVLKDEPNASVFWRPRNHMHHIHCDRLARQTLVLAFAADQPRTSPTYR